MKQWSILFVILLLGSYNAILSETTMLEGSMVGHYEFEVSETSNNEHPNIVNLTLTGELKGVNLESPYYNCGVTERLMMIRCRIPGQDYEELFNFDITIMYSILSEEYSPQYGRWYCFPIAIAVTFMIYLQSIETEMTFTIETETDIIDFTTNSSQTTTVSESASFEYLMQTDYTNTFNLFSFSLGAYFAVVGVTVIFLIVTTKILPEEIE